MNITIVSSNGEKVQAAAEHWLVGLIAMLDEGEASRLMELVKSRVQLVTPKTHVISVPGIPTGERFGKF